VFATEAAPRGSRGKEGQKWRKRQCYNSRREQKAGGYSARQTRQVQACASSTPAMSMSFVRLYGYGHRTPRRKNAARSARSVPTPPAAARVMPAAAEEKKRRSGSRPPEASPPAEMSSHRSLKPRARFRAFAAAIFANITPAKCRRRSPVAAAPALPPAAPLPPARSRPRCCRQRSAWHQQVCEEEAAARIARRAWFTRTRRMKGKRGGKWRRMSSRLSSHADRGAAAGAGSRLQSAAAPARQAQERTFDAEEGQKAACVAALFRRLPSCPSPC